MLLALLACAPTSDDPPAPAARCEVSPRPFAGCGDLDCDGRAEVLFAQTEDAAGRYVATSTIAWGDGSTTALPTVGAADVAVADLDGDDRPEVIYANLSDGEVRQVDSYVYWNGPDGLSDAQRTALPTVGASDVEVADLDGDGWPDLAFANRYDGGSATNADSYRVDVWVYLGGPDGYAAERRIAAPGFGAAQTAVADLDGDGWNELAIAAGTFHADVSWLYRGGPDGYIEARRDELPTAAPEGVIAADLDRDGHPDLAFANFYAAGDLEIDSTVYWGGPDGLSGRTTALPTSGADDLVAADVTGDGCPELVVANAMQGTFFDLDFTADSAIWSFDGEAPATIAALPTVSAAAAAVGDVDGDGYPDVAFANRYDEAGGPDAVSRVYLGGPDGFDATRFRAYPATGAAGVAIAAP